MNRVYVDFLKVDDSGRIRLNAIGTVADLTRLGIALADGTRLDVYSDDEDDKGRPDPLVAAGEAHLNQELGEWVLELDASGIRHASDV